MYKKNISNIIIFCLAIVITLTSCSGPPVDSGVTVTDVNEYLNVNDFVKEKIKDDFNGLLPNTINRKLSEYDYYYYYECAFIGNPCFVIKLNATYDDVLYLEEKERIENLEAKEMIESENKIYSFCDSNDFEYYFDEQVNDGRNLRFEIAILNDDKNEIEYLVASVYDEHGSIDVLTDFLVINELENSSLM